MSLHYKYDNWVKDQEGFGGHDRSMDVKEREKRCDGGGTIPANKFKITCAYPKEKSYNKLVSEIVIYVLRYNNDIICIHTMSTRLEKYICESRKEHL